MFLFILLLLVQIFFTDTSYSREKQVYIDTYKEINQLVETYKNNSFYQAYPTIKEDVEYIDQSWKNNYKGIEKKKKEEKRIKIVDKKEADMLEQLVKEERKKERERDEIEYIDQSWESNYKELVRKKEEERIKEEKIKESNKLSEFLKEERVKERERDEIEYIDQSWESNYKELVRKKEEERETEKEVDNIPDYIIVEKKDTLYNISKQYNIDLFKLKKINSLTSNNIDIGQKIYLKDNLITKKEAEHNKSNQTINKYLELAELGRVHTKFNKSPEKKYYNGILIESKENKKIKLILDGVVIYTSNKQIEEYNSLILIAHYTKDNLISIYADVEDIQVKSGDRLFTGNNLGYVGKSNKFYLEIRENKKFQNPQKYLK